MGLQMPDIDRAVFRTVDHFLATPFGKRSGARLAGMHRVGGTSTWVEGKPGSTDEARDERRLGRAGRVSVTSRGP